MKRLPLIMRILAVLPVVLVAAGVYGCGRAAAPAGPTIDVAAALGGGSTDGYAQADAPRQFVFPQDHYAHPDFRNEWWYFTGNLYDGAGHRFGYQLTIFRIAISPAEADRSSAWATSQVWMAHFAISDGASQKFYDFQKLERGALGLAGFAPDGFALNVDDWSITGGGDAGFPWSLYAEDDGVVLSVQVQPEKAIVLEGDNGLSRKSLNGKNASYYYSITRLETSGYIEIGGKKYAVSGLSWFDREWSTSALSSDQSGWDWFSLQLNDGTDIVYYQLRYKDGSVYPLNQGLIVAADGGTTSLGTGAITLKVLKTWRSPLGGTYPVEWQADVAALGKTLVIKAVFPQQELNLSTRYWEGMVDIFDAADTAHAIGSGYLEMTGYAG